MQFYLIVFSVCVIILAVIWGRRYLMITGKVKAKNLDSKRLFNKFMRQDLGDEFVSLENNELETLAGGAIDSKDYDSAVKYLLILEKRDLVIDKLYDVLNALATIYFEKEDYRNAKIRFKRMIEMNATDAYLLARVAECAFLLDELGESLELFEKALVLNPNEVQFLEGKALVYRKLQKHDKAREIKQQIMNFGKNDNAK